MTLADFRAKVGTRIKDVSTRLNQADIDAAILSAVEEYSRDRPREVVVTVAGTASFDYLVSTFGSAASGTTPSTQWVDGASQLISLVFPYDASSQGFEPLSDDDFELVRLPSNQAIALRFLSMVPAVGETALVTFTRPHDVTGVFSTVPAGDVEAFSDLCAYYALLELMAFYSQRVDPTIDADVTGNSSVPDDYEALADKYRARYDAHVGKSTGRGGAASSEPAAGVLVDLDRSFGDHVRTDYFFHGRRRF